MADAVLSQFKQQEEKEVISSDKKLKIGIMRDRLDRGIPRRKLSYNA